MIKPGAVLSRARARVPVLDHLVRTYGRYQTDTGDRLAAAVTFYWFLSLFPILLLVLSAYGYLHAGESAEELNRRLRGSLGGFLPPQLVDTLTETLSGAKGRAGLLGLAGLLLAGLGWIEAMREAIRTVWHQNVQVGNFLTRKLVDIVALVGLFATIAASAFVTGLAGSGPEWLLDQLDVDQTTAAKVFLKVLGIALAALVDVALFLYLFLRLAKVSTPWRPVLSGAIFGAIGFGVLKLVGGFYVQRTTERGEATYGTFAVVVGLLLFLNLVSRLVLLAAAFAVTAPGDDDVRPSGTADPVQARRAGIPVRFADQGMSIQEDGAPTPLRSALHGVSSPPASVVRPPVEPKGAQQVRFAAGAVGGLMSFGVLAIVVYALKTVRRVLSR